MVVTILVMQLFMRLLSFLALAMMTMMMVDPTSDEKVRVRAGKSRGVHSRMLSVRTPVTVVTHGRATVELIAYVEDATCLEDLMTSASKTGKMFLIPRQQAD